MRRFGKNLGMAFQIVDDVLDLRESTDHIGKPAGHDLRQGTVTLPTMLFLQNRLGDASSLALVEHVLTESAPGDHEVAAAVLAIRRSGAIEQAIELNGAAVEANKRAFEIGRWASVNPAEAERVLTPVVVERPKSLEERIAFRADHLAAYQSKRLARRYRRLVDGIADPRLKDAVAKGYHKLLAYKDEYEVARLYTDGAFQQKIASLFEGDVQLKFHLAPPLLAKRNSKGELVKRPYGPWVMKAFGVLARLKALRGTALDPFGRTEERRAERALIREYEDCIQALLPTLDAGNHALALEIARIPDQIKGYGHVKERNLAAARSRWQGLMAQWHDGGTQRQVA